MPGKIKVKVLAGRNLPVMDRAGDTTDAFVEIKFGGITHKTDVCRKSLNPHWSSTEWYRFEVDESELQDEPLQLRLMDHDTYSANDAIGKVVISLAPLLAKEANNTKTVASHGGAVMSGWIPVFDTMHGIRGELNIIVKVELFSDFNKYKTSSCGVQFFHCKEIPPGYRATAIHGFVEELVVNDDPEYQWIDKIRTPRASNEARQVAFIKLSNQVQRLVGLKAAELGANAVVGYQQDFDLEGEAGVVARAIGTAVSITPLPTPSQPLNIPPCTQQQLKKYLDILAIDGESITDMNEYFQSHQEELQKLLNILNPRTSSIFDDTENMDDNDDEGGDFTRSSSTKTYTGNASIYLDDYMSQRSMRHLSEDQGDLNKLLNKNDDDSDSSGPLRTIKKIKTNFLTKRFSSIRSRSRSEKSDDQISIKSNSSDTSRISLLEIKNEFKKLRRFKKPKVRKQFVNIADEGIGMASVLARSVIHAHTSLACIAETQDSEPSPNSTMRRTSESEPMLNLSDEEQNKVEGTKESPLAAKETSSLDVKKKIPDISIKSTSLKNLNSEEEEPFENRRKLSDSCPTSPVSGRSSNLLKTAEVGYSGSVSSALSGESSEVYTSSEDDEESLKTDTDPIETVSSVVQTVLNNDVNPKIIAQMERKLSIFDGENPSYNNQKHSEKSLDDLNTIKEKPQESTSTNDDSNSILDKNKTSVQNVQQFARSKSHSFHFKFHNPFSHKKVSKSISAPSSPVEKTGFMYRSSCRIKRQFYKISNSNMMKSLSHYSLILKKKPQETKKAVSESNSSSDVPSKAPSHETVLGSPFLSYTDLLSLDKEYDIDKIIQRPDNFEHSDVKMYIGSEPVSRASYSGPSSLYEESHNHERKIRKKPSLKPTGLVHTAMETILMDKVHSLLVPTSPDGTGTVKDSKFFDDVSQRLEKLEESKSKICETPKSKFSIESEDSRDVHIKRHESDLKPSGLIQTAMQTILIDKMQNILAPMSAEISKEQKFFDDVNKKLEDLDVKDCKSDICETQRTTQGSNSIESKSSEKQRRKSDLKPSGLIQTAMQTILIDKVENILAPIPIEETEEKKHDDDVHRKLENIESRSRIFETSKSESPIKALKEVKEGHIKQNESDLKPSGLIQTAMKTILIDKVQDILAPVSSDLPEENNFVVQTNNKKDEVSISEPKSRICETPQSKSSIKSEDSKEEQTIRNESDLKTSGVIQTAKPSILIAKEQNVSKKFVDLEDKLCRSRICETPESISATNAEDKQGEGKESSKGGMIQTAMQTILFDKVQNLLAPVSSESSENVSRTAKNKTVETIESSSQDSVNSDEEPKTNSHKMSKELMNVITPCKITRSTPVLQHFHPILSGPNLETIPSLPESQTESLDIEGVEHSCDYECDPNLPSVCDNSHAACDVDRSEREKIDKEKDRDKGSPKHSRHESYGGKDLGVTPVQNPSLNSSSTPMGIHRRSSDSDLSVTPKGGSLNTSAGNTGSGGGAILRPSMNSNNLDMLEYPFLTMTEYPPGFIVHIGGTVCARSVKLVEGEGGGGAAWWAELRTELRAHARALRCHAVLAYTDTAQMCEDVCILSASGTAAVINLDCNFNAEDTFSIPGAKLIEEEKPPAAPCSMVHVPYSPGTEPYRAELSLCATCRRARVPAVLLATCAKPSQLTSHGKSVLLTAVAGRIRRAPPTSEPGARDISDQLPFLEYELHKLLLAKLRMQGANALFSLQTQITAGERCVMALASGAAVRLAALPAPTPPTIKASENDKEAIEIQKKIWDTFTMNKTANGFDIVPTEQATNGTHTDTEATDAPVLDLCSDKDACLLELDEAEDVETAKSLAVRRNHMQVYNRSLKASPANPHAFAQVWRARLPLTSAGNLGGEWHVARCLDNIHYKLRTLAPLALAAPRLAMQLPEDEIQVMVSGTVIPLLNPTKADVGGNSDQTSAQANGQGEDDEIFSLDEEQMTKSSESKEEKLVIGQQPTTVSLTTLPEVSGSRSVRAICALKLLFVRETTAVRELGGLSGFLHTFTCEVLAIVRAYTTALGGNALTSFYINQLMLQDNAHKNQGQCLVSVGGDIVHVTY